MATTFMFVDPAQKNFLDAIPELFKNQEGIDAVLVCQDVHWEVHAAVLLARCRETRADNIIAVNL